jgi:hypothetical protein
MPATARNISGTAGAMIGRSDIPVRPLP